MVSSDTENLSGNPGVFPVGSVVFNKFEILEFIAAGGGGVVYRALDSLRNVEVGLKVLHLQNADAKTQMRFQHEAQIASKLNHKNIARVNDFELFEGTPYLSMEFVKGISLRAALEQDGLSPADVLEIFFQIAQAVAHAHSHNVVHRDLKPENVMVERLVDQSIEVKVLDFGIAKWIDGHNERNLTPTGNIVGSPLYMSPEQGQGKETSSMTDVYSLGCMLFEAMSGEPPFKGSTAIETIMMHQSEPVPSLESVADIGYYSVELCDLVEEMLSKSEKDRPQLAVVIPLLAPVDNVREPLFVPELTPSDAYTPGLKNWKIWVSVSSGILALGIVAVGVMLKKELQVAPPPPPASTSSDALHEKQLFLAENRVLDLADPRNHAAEEANKLGNEGLTLHSYESTPETKDQALVAIAEPRKFGALNLGKSQVATLEGLPRFSKLERLLLDETAVSDQSLKNIVPLNSTLKVLSLAHTKIGDDSFEYIKKLTNLERLDLRGTRVTKAGLVKIKPLVHLLNLSLGSTSITANDFKAIAMSITPSCAIGLRNTRVSEKQKLELAKLYPDLEIDPFQRFSVNKLKGQAYKCYSQSPPDTATVKRLLKEVISIVEKAYGKGTFRARSYYLFQAGMQEREHNRTAADANFRLAIAGAKTDNDVMDELGYVNAYINFLSSAPKVDVDKVIPYIKRCSELYAKAYGRGKLFAKRCQQLGCWCLRFKRYDLADKYFSEAVGLMNRMTSPNPLELALTYGYWGDVAFLQTDLANAAARYRKCIKLFETNEPEDLVQWSALSMVYFNAARIEITSKNFDNATMLNSKGLVIAKREHLQKIVSDLLLNQRSDIEALRAAAKAQPVTKERTGSVIEKLAE